MLKKSFVFLLFFTFTVSTFAQNQKIKFVKGNISDKTAAVREATGDEGIWLSNEAINFVLKNKSMLGNDRELDGLAVAAILSIPIDYTKNCSDADKKIINDQFIELFNTFNKSNTVQIAILSKLLQCKDYLPLSDFTKLLNNTIASININSADSSVVKSIINALEYIGDNESFLILYKLLNNQKYINYQKELDNAITALIPNAMNEVIQLIHEKNIKQITQIFSLIKKSENISKNYLCEIAENVLSESIILLESSSKVTSEIIALQLDSLKILSENKWTRSSAVCLSYFQIAKVEFENDLITDKDFTNVISALSNIAPIDSVLPLNLYLEELNGLTEKGNTVSNDVVLAVIKTLGAIGDKSAFDSLLAVTYLSYPEEILSAAREALAGLRW